MVAPGNSKERPLTLEERTVSMSESHGVYLTTGILLFIGIPMLVAGIVFLAMNKHYDTGIGLMVGGMVLSLLACVFILLIATGNYSKRHDRQEATSGERSRAARLTPIGPALEAMGPAPPPYGNSSGQSNSTGETTEPDASGPASLRRDHQGGPVNFREGVAHGAFEPQFMIATIPMPGTSSQPQTTGWIPHNLICADQTPGVALGHISSPGGTPPLATSSLPSREPSSNPNTSLDSSLSGYASLS